MKSFAVVFSGVGTQWKGMARELLGTSEFFLEGFREFAEPFRVQAGWSVEDALQADDIDIASATIGHPCILAINFGLLRLIQSNGFKPVLYMGHSGGEVAAAWAAGVLTAEDAAFLAFQHCRVLEQASGKGKMLHFPLPLGKVQQLIDAYSDDVCIAAINSPSSVVCSGNTAILEQLAAQHEQKGVRFLRIDAPFHAPGIEPWLDEFGVALANLRPLVPHTPIVSTLHAGLTEARGDMKDFDAAYWKRHISEPVRFAEAVQTALTYGIRLFAELSPHAVLQSALADTARMHGVAIESIGAMFHDGDSVVSTQGALGVLSQWTEGKAGKVKLSEEGHALAQMADASRVAALRTVISEILHSISPTLAEGDDAETLPFQARGLTSLLAMRLCSHLSSRLGVVLPVSDVFKYPDTASLAQRVSRLISSQTTADGVKTTEGHRAAGNEHEPLAVVGGACRLPGGIIDLNSYWDFIREGKDAVIPIPADRWDRDRYYNPDREVPGTMHTRESAFLTTPIDQFDPFFFTISAREAVQLDPQQRLLLELAWEAFEDAGIDPDAWRGKQAGVFLGMTGSEYSHAHRESYKRELIDAYSLTGSTQSGAAGRLSYFFDFKGPCFSVDTACSSGLVALHCACRSLRSGESDLTVVGGITLMLTPDLHICFTKLGAISPDGRSKAFDDNADGYGRGEGGVIVLLKRLSDAERDGDRILGLVRGTALNQDGKSNGLTAPNGLAQEQVVATALRDANLSPLDVGYVEAHGTGTTLGDLIELDSLAASYCGNRSPEEPLHIGSVKANIGHLEPAAALASLLKVLLCAKHREIPANIHIKRPNSKFDFKRNAIAAPTTLTPWQGKLPFRAGINAFGFSGINGHAIVEEYIVEEHIPQHAVAEPGRNHAANTSTVEYFLLLLSAKTRESLQLQVRKCLERIRGAGSEELGAICRTYACGRSHFRYRLALVARSSEEMAAQLANAKEQDFTVAPAVAPDDRLSLLFTGQGSQYPGMGKELYAAYAPFREALDRCAAVLQQYDIDLLHMLFGGTSAEELTNTAISQPLIASFSYAIWQLWKSFGMRFSAALGHSIGEYPAAVAAGVMTLEQMLALAVKRGAAMNVAEPGGMVAVFTDKQTLQDVLQGFPSLSIASENAPQSLVVAGSSPELESCVTLLKQKGILSTRLHVSHAFHSPAMQRAAELFASSLSDVMLAKPKDMDFISSVDGSRNNNAVATANYWSSQITTPVHFAVAVSSLAKQSDLAVEVGPSASLSGLVGQIGSDLQAVASAAPGKGGIFMLLSAAGKLFKAGVTIDWTRVFAPYSRQHVSIPGYQFQRERYWMPLVVDPPMQLSSAASVIGERMESPAFDGKAVFQCVFSDDGPFFLHEHIIFAKAISPAAGHMAMMLAVARDLWGQDHCELRDVQFANPLVVKKGETRHVQIIVDTPDAPKSLFSITSRCVAQDDETVSTDTKAGGWQKHCNGILVKKVSPRPTPDFSAEDFFTVEVSKKGFYDHFVSSGYTVGEGFRRLEKLSIQGNMGHCLVETRRNSEGEAGHVIYPGSLDSIMQTGFPALMDEIRKELAVGSLLIPLHVERLTLWGNVPDKLWCRAVTQTIFDGTAAINSTILGLNAEGQPVLELEGFFFLVTDSATLYRDLNTDPLEQVYVQDWVVEDIAAANAAEGNVAVLPLGNGELARACCELPGMTPCDSDIRLMELLSQESDVITLLVVHSCGTDDLAVMLNKEHEAAARFMSILRLLAESDRPVRLHLVTSGVTGGACLGKDSGQGNPGGASLWGMAESFALENPDIVYGMADLDVVANDADLQVVQRLLGSERPYRSAVRQGICYAAKLATAKRQGRGEDVPDSAFTGSHLITGGSGALALQTAEWLADRGAECIAFFSRTGKLSGKGAVVADALRQRGITVLELQGDVTNRGDVEAAVTAIRRDGPPLRGVFHAAGVLDDGVLTNMTPERLKKVMAPKVDGVVNLHCATIDVPLTHFVCYSSAGTLLSSPGQASYNAANHFLNAFTRWRRALGLASSCPCWGPWADGGMAENADRTKENLVRQGILSIRNKDAFASLLAAEGQGLCVFGVMIMDWKQFALIRGSDETGYFNNVMPMTHAVEKEEGSASRLVERITDEATGAFDPVILSDGLRGIAARQLGLANPEAIMADKSLLDYGFDSLMVVEFRKKVGHELGMSLPVSALFEFPTIEKLTQWLCSENMKNASVAPVKESIFAIEPAKASPAPVEPLQHNLNIATTINNIDELLNG
jgi:Polyketide synthase modules and related proteins